MIVVNCYWIAGEEEEEEEGGLFIDLGCLVGILLRDRQIVEQRQAMSKKSVHSG